MARPSDPGKAHVRAALIDAARELFVRQTYGATSLEQVADAAGYATDDVHAVFGGKDALCVAVLEDIERRELASLWELLDTGTDFDTKLAQLGEWVDRTLRGGAWNVLSIEANAAAISNERLRTRLAERDAAACAVVTEFLREQADAGVVTLALPAEDLATILCSVGIGLGVQCANNPEIRTNAFIDAVRALAPQR